MKEVAKPQPMVKKKKREGYYYKRYLYKMTFPNDMVYIGTAYDIEERWKNNGSGYRGQKVWSAIQEFGWENIKKEILLYLTPDENDCWSDTRNSQKIRDRERELIKEYDGRCYNQQCTKDFHEAISLKNKAKGLHPVKKYLTVEGVTKPLKDWCEEYNIGCGQVQKRMDNWGLSPKQALTFPRVPHNMAGRPLEYWKQCGCL